MDYKPSGVCSKQIKYDIIDGKVYNVSYDGGCSGNLQGITRLVDGLPAKLVIEKLKGIKCGYKGTSCPDQLAKALEEELHAR